MGPVLLLLYTGQSHSSVGDSSIVVYGGGRGNTLLLRYGVDASLSLPKTSARLPSPFCYLLLQACSENVDRKACGNESSAGTCRLLLHVAMRVGSSSNDYHRHFKRCTAMVSVPLFLRR